MRTRADDPAQVVMEPRLCTTSRFGGKSAPPAISMRRASALGVGGGQAHKCMHTV